MTRHFRPPKPHPAGILYIGNQWGIRASEMIMVGDSMDDMIAGREAGVTTVLLLDKDDHNTHLIALESVDCVINR